MGASAHLTLLGTKAAAGAEQLMIAAEYWADCLSILVSAEDVCCLKAENVRCSNVFTLVREFVGKGD